MVSRYAESNFLAIQGFVSSEFARSLLSATSNLAVRTVICGDENIRFGQQDVPEDHSLFAFFLRDDMVSLVQRLTQASDGIRWLVCWTSVYEVGQYINPHTDIDGDIQVTICLQSPGQENGGRLCVELPGSTQELLLAPGDAVVFKASAIRHYTTPLAATERDALPRRVVAVGRYFFGRPA
ncbi:MAG TPA: hypothetical protein VH593_07565 [Ktedonobacteraceae bacterium]|jgi:hypothetical protein